jgi:hypothetical protein
MFLQSQHYFFVRPIPNAFRNMLKLPTEMNRSLSPEINTPSNGSFPITTPLGGDGVFTKDCLYKGETFSPGSIVPMPGGNKECQNNGTWL